MRFRPFCLLAAAALSTTSAWGLIVVDGKIVPAWPDQHAPDGDGPSGPQRAQLGLGFYPAPKGVVHGLTLLVDFSDTSPAFTAAEVDAWLNQPGFSRDGLNGSVRDYFFETSNGVVDFQNQVVGFYRAKQPKSHYEEGNDYRGASELVTELMAAVDDEVDFSLFDNDGDGRTESISIVYAGNAKTWGQGLWPHSGSINQMRDGVRVTRYQMTAMEQRFVLYTFVHEVGHMLFGWPDLYGFGNYCVMGNASNPANPVGINDFYRADQGWIPVIDIDAQTNRRFYANVNAGGYRYVNPKRPDEAFFWSNVQSTDRWSSLRGSGLVVLHFDAKIRNNDPPNPLSLAVVQADGKRQLDQTMWPEPGSEQADFYTAAGNAELAANTTPSSAWNDGSPSGLRLYDVSASGESMTFTVGTGTPEPGIGGAGGGPGGTGGAALGGAAVAGAAPGGAGGTLGTGGTAGTTTSGGTLGDGGTANAGDTGASGGTLAGTSNGGTSTGAGITGTGAGATSGAAGAPGATPSDTASGDASCGCRIFPTQHPRTLALSSALFVALAALRRRPPRTTDPSPRTP